MKIGIFDSGVGGMSVVRAIQTAHPEYEVIFKNDTKNVPYGNKQPSELVSLVIPFLKEFETDGCAAVVIACNTVSTNCISELRSVCSIPLIAMEPMVKPAAQLTKSKIIAVCATPATLASARYAELKQTFAKGIRVLEPDCSGWSYLIETNQRDELQLETSIGGVLEKGADVIVLGCTHYHWIEADILMIAGDKAIILQPEVAVIAQLERVLERSP